MTKGWESIEVTAPAPLSTTLSSAALPHYAQLELRIKALVYHTFFVDAIYYATRDILIL